MRKRDVVKNLQVDKESTKKYIEMSFDDLKDSMTYLGKVKISDMENDDYILTLYKKGVVYRRLRRIGVVDSNEERTITYKQNI